MWMCCFVLLKRHFIYVCFKHFHLRITRLGSVLSGTCVVYLCMCKCVCVCGYICEGPAFWWTCAWVGVGDQTRHFSVGNLSSWNCHHCTRPSTFLLRIKVASKNISSFVLIFATNLTDSSSILSFLPSKGLISACPQALFPIASLFSMYMGFSSFAVEIFGSSTLLLNLLSVTRK